MRWTAGAGPIADLIHAVRLPYSGAAPCLPLHVPRLDVHPLYLLLTI